MKQRHQMRGVGRLHDVLKVNAAKVPNVSHCLSFAFAAKGTKVQTFHKNRVMNILILFVCFEDAAAAQESTT